MTRAGEGSGNDAGEGSDIGTHDGSETGAGGEGSDIGADNDLHVVLVNPEIHGNTGSSGRTCLAAGAQLHLVEPLGFSLDDARVKRAGLDYWPRVRPRVWEDWERLETHLPELGEPYLFSSDGGIDFWDIRFAKRAVLVFGRESVGLPPAVTRRYTDRVLRLPMIDPGLRSLNLANSVAVALYEVLRQRRALVQNGEASSKPIPRGGHPRA